MSTLLDWIHVSCNNAKLACCLHLQKPPKMPLSLLFWKIKRISIICWVLQFYYVLLKMHDIASTPFLLLLHITIPRQTPVKISVWFLLYLNVCEQQLYKQLLSYFFSLLPCFLFQLCLPYTLPFLWLVNLNFYSMTTCFRVQHMLWQKRAKPDVVSF